MAFFFWAFTLTALPTANLDALLPQSSVTVAPSIFSTVHFTLAAQPTLTVLSAKASAITSDKALLLIVSSCVENDLQSLTLKIIFTYKFNIGLSHCLF